MRWEGLGGGSVGSGRAGECQRQCLSLEVSGQASQWNETKQFAAIIVLVEGQRSTGPIR